MIEQYQNIKEASSSFTTWVYFTAAVKAQQNMMYLVNLFRNFMVDAVYKRERHSLFVNFQKYCVMLLLFFSRRS